METTNLGKNCGDVFSKKERLVLEDASDSTKVKRGEKIEQVDVENKTCSSMLRCVCLDAASQSESM